MKISTLEICRYTKKIMIVGPKKEGEWASNQRKTRTSNYKPTT